MIITRRIKNAYSWHRYFAILPVLTKEELEDASTIYGQQSNTLKQEYAYFEWVERKLETNMTGTRRWIFRSLGKTNA